MTPQRLREIINGSGDEDCLCRICIKHATELRQYADELEAAERERDALLNELTDTWMIRFDDPDRDNEIFSGKGAERSARHRYEVCLQSWTCQLFRMIARKERP